MISDNNYIHIEGWMVTKLGLSGNALIVYACVYGFSQDGISYFKGSRQYLADWCNVTVRGVQNNLNSLVEAGYLEKMEYTENNQTLCQYRCNPNLTPPVKKVHPPVKKVPTPREKSSPNTIDNTIEEKEVSKDTCVTRKKNLYEKCLDIIDEEFIDTDIREALKSFLKIRISKRKNGQNALRAESFRTIIKEINSLADTKEEALKIINNAICYENWKFYPLNSSDRKNTYRDNIVSPKDEKTEEEKLWDRYVEYLSSLGMFDEKPNYDEWRKNLKCS